MIQELDGRLVLRCDHCPVRMDLGLANVVKARNRTPSGWIRTGAYAHACPLCAPNYTLPAMYAARAGRGVQPLL